MGTVGRSALTLRFMGDDLRPADLTSALGVPPELAYAKGETWFTPGGKAVVARSGLWTFAVPDRSPADPNGQLDELFASILADTSVWWSLAARYQGNLFVGLFLDDHNQGLTLSPRAMAAVGERGLAVDLDIYSAPDDGGV